MNDGRHLQLYRILTGILDAARKGGYLSGSWIRQQRLEALIYQQELPENQLEGATASFCREVYLAQLVQVEQARRVVGDLGEKLATEGISAIAWRGLFYGEQLYGDPAVRAFTDMDILVPTSERNTVLDLLKANGFAVRGGVPEWFYERHHLHWPLTRGADRMHIDLHWMVDHPYRRYTIDYESIFSEAGPGAIPGFLSFRPEHEMIVAAIHAEKESRSLTRREGIDSRLFRDGPVFPWLDLCLLLENRAGTGELDELAEAWGVGHVWRHAMSVVTAMTSPDGLVADKKNIRGSSRRTPVPLVSGIAMKAGFRPECVSDWWAYTFPGKTRKKGLGAFAERIRYALEGVWAGCRLAVDLLRCSPAWAFSGRKTVLAVILLMAAGTGWSDDIGNSPSEAFPVAVNAGPVDGNLEMDVDRDWFQFQAQPAVVYTVTVSNTSLWDHDATLQLFVSGGVLAQTTSAFRSQAASSLVWTNHGGVRTTYAGVSGLFQFTTGRYSFAVSGDETDSDHDDMVDQWELDHFLTLTNDASGDVDGDGVVNGIEYQTGSNPTNPASRLMITNLEMIAASTLIQWPAAVWGSYRVEATANLDDEDAWTFLGRITSGGTAGPENFLADQRTNRWTHYRVVYE